VLEEVKAWQERELDAVYPIVYMDALRVKIRGEGRHVESRAVHVAMGVNMEGAKQVLGLWIGNNEGAKYWLGVLTELASRGVKDIFIACVDGLKGFPEAIEAVFPNTQVQRCIVHLVRDSLNYVPWKERKAVAASLRTIYTAATEAEAADKLNQFCQSWDAKYPMVSQVWIRAWQNVIPFFGYPPDIRRVIYTTNAIESLNMSMRKVIKTRGGFPNEDAALKLLFLGLRNASAKWTMPVQNWKQALNVFAILMPDRVPQ
jgi:putative transposase